MAREGSLRTMGHMWIRATAAIAVAGLCAACTPPTPSQPQPQEQVYELTGEGAALNGKALLFGADPDTTVALMEQEWGTPTADSGWGSPRVPWGPCGGTTARVLTWGSLQVLLGDMPEQPGFTSWRVEFPVLPGTPVVQVRPRLAEPGMDMAAGVERKRVEQGYAGRIAVSPPEESYDYLAGSSAFVVFPMEPDTRSTPPLNSAVYGAFADAGTEPVVLLEAGGICGE